MNFKLSISVDILSLLIICGLFYKRSNMTRISKHNVTIGKYNVMKSTYHLKNIMLS